MTLMTIYAGFDVGGTNARVSIYDVDGAVLGTAKSRIRDATRPDEVAETLEALLEEVFDGARAEAWELSAVGLGLAGQMSKNGEIVVNGPNLGWRDVPFAELMRAQLAERFGEVRVRVVNDLSALIWGEAFSGAIKGSKDVLAVYVGTGVGGAILSGGELVDGSGGKAGEIGHVKVVRDGRLCGCGQRGCLEAYAGGVHLERQVAEVAHAHGLEQLFRPDVPGQVDLARADGLSATVEPLGELWERATTHLATSLANACTLLNPEVLLLGGGVLMNLENFRLLTLAKTSPLILDAARDDMEIRFPMLGDDAGMLGAALLGMSSHP
jgi:glucokinase